MGLWYRFRAPALLVTEDINEVGSLTLTVDSDTGSDIAFFIAKMSESQGSGLFSLRNLAIIVALVIAAIGYQEFQHNWVNMPPLTPDRFPSRPFTVHEIPTTYYQVGELGDVLDGWHKGSYLKGYIHLYMQCGIPSGFSPNYQLP